MGNSISYLTPDNDLGEISKGRWKVMRRLLEVFLDYVNESMNEPWPAGHFRNVVLSDARTLAPGREEVGEAPPTGAFAMSGILDDLSDEIDEVIIVDAVELRRLFAWARFLEQRDGSFEFFVPLVNTLRGKTAKLEHYVTDG